MYIKIGRKKHSLADVAFNTFNAIVMIFLIVSTLYPFLNTLAVSFNDGTDALRGNTSLA